MRSGGRLQTPAILVPVCAAAQSANEPDEDKNRSEGAVANKNTHHWSDCSKTAEQISRSASSQSHSTLACCERCYSHDAFFHTNSYVIS